MGQTVWVTGASGNLGRAVIRHFLERGHQVAGIYVQGETPGRETDSSLFTYVHADLLDETGTMRAFHKLVESHGPPSVAVMTVGGFTMGNLVDTPWTALEAQLSLNFQTAYISTRAVFNLMRPSGRGRIFLLGARPGLDMSGARAMAGYALSKSLIFRLSELINAESVGTEIVCSVLVPSIIDTPQNRSAMPEADHSTWVSPETIAEIIDFYASPAAVAVREPVIKIYNHA